MCKMGGASRKDKIKDSLATSEIDESRKHSFLNHNSYCLLHSIAVKWQNLLGNGDMGIEENSINERAYIIG
jgi:hypothetical protein